MPVIRMLPTIRDPRRARATRESIDDVPVAVIAFIDEQRVWFKAKIGLEVDEIPRDDSFCAHAILQFDVLIVPDPISDKRFVSSFLVKEIGIRFYAGMPLIPVDNYPVCTHIRAAR
jgi:GAF domain-containing protein